MNGTDKAYMDFIRYILKNGITKSDRTGTGTISVFDYNMKFNMAEGLPVLTSKKMYFKGIIYELMWMMNNHLGDPKYRKFQNTNIKYLVDNNVNIWVGDAYKNYSEKCNNPVSREEFIELIKTDNEFSNMWGNLGPIYGSGWRRTKKIILVDEENLILYKNLPKKIKINGNINIDYNNNKHQIVGKKFHSKNNGDFSVIREYYIDNTKRCKFDIRFEDSGFVKAGVYKGNILKGEVYDPYYPSVCEVGCIGEVSKTEPFYKELYSIWIGMINRCYNTNDKYYHRYGGIGIYVDDNWLIFANFYEQSKLIEGWDMKLNSWGKYSLDKDYYQSNKYSIDTCVWRNQIDQISYTNIPKTFKSIAPDGSESINKNISRYAEINNFSIYDISDCLKGKKDNVKGWKFQYVNIRKKYVVIEYIDQLKILIEELKNNPDSRRLIVNSWNVSDLGNMILPPCHFVFQCWTYEMSSNERMREWCKSINKNESYGDKIKDEDLDKLNFPKRKLSLKFNMRSNDAFLGNPYNITSYAILLCLIGKEVNMIPNELIYNGGDCHIYLNHIDQVKLQLKQETYNLPILKLKNNSIWDCNPEDIIIENYKSSPPIKGKLSN